MATYRLWAEMHAQRLRALVAKGCCLRVMQGLLSPCRSAALRITSLLGVQDTGFVPLCGPESALVLIVARALRRRPTQRRGTPLHTPRALLWRRARRASWAACARRTARRASRRPARLPARPHNPAACGGHGLYCSPRRRSNNAWVHRDRRAVLAMWGVQHPGTIVSAQGSQPASRAFVLPAVCSRVCCWRARVGAARVCFRVYFRVVRWGSCAAACTLPACDKWLRKGYGLAHAACEPALLI